MTYRKMMYRKNPFIIFTGYIFQRKSNLEIQSKPLFWCPNGLFPKPVDQHSPTVWF